jgi:hypothetical protein
LYLASGEVVGEVLYEDNIFMEGYLGMVAINENNEGRIDIGREERQP